MLLKYYPERYLEPDPELAFNGDLTVWTHCLGLGLGLGLGIRRFQPTIFWTVCVFEDYSLLLSWSPAQTNLNQEDAGKNREHAALVR